MACNAKLDADTSTFVLLNLVYGCSSSIRLLVFFLIFLQDSAVVSALICVRVCEFDYFAHAIDKVKQQYKRITACIIIFIFVLMS